MEESCYISGGANATPQAVHWGNNNLICYSSCNAVFIYDPTIGGGKITKTLCKHTKKVNAVKWITGGNFETELVSCSADGKVIVWTYEESTYKPIVLEGHKGTVNVLDALYKDIELKNAVIASAGVDSTVRIWNRTELKSEFEPIQQINLGYSLCITVKLSFFECKTLFLACAIDNSNIDLYVDENENVLHFTQAGTLKGHEDWVRGIDCQEDGYNLLLASCGQDNFIRMHEISVVTSPSSPYDFKTTKQNYKITLKSILMGHDGWVYSVNWSQNSLRLLSASLDKSLIIWEYDEVAQLWLESIRLGEVGGNTLGFYGAMFSPDSSAILGFSYHGAFHVWDHVAKYNMWNPAVRIGGHYAEVADLGWEPEGEFLISVSADQTARVHAPWKSAENMITWHEIARPQVHGYDLGCMAILSRYRYASGAEEKVIRVFKAPTNFKENFQRICFIDETQDGESEELPKGASVPSLGLSNKAVFADNNKEYAVSKNNKQPYPEESYFVAVDLYSPPTEETLIQNTLWPEIQKLYGHGYEVFSMASSKDGSVLASACKSSSAEHAAIILWDTTSWQQKQKLISHTLTVAQMSFSPDGNHLLSVSRDRRWSLFSKMENEFRLVATTDKHVGIHSRIIWCCAWSHDSTYFATGSRDGKAVVWRKNEEKSVENCLGKYEAASQCLQIKESITAIAFAPNLIGRAYIIAVGVESGEIMVYRWMQKWDKAVHYYNDVAHHLTVKRLAFRPVMGCAGQQQSDDYLQLASCSSDHSVRIYNIHINSLA